MRFPGSALHESDRWETGRAEMDLLLDAFPDPTLLVDEDFRILSSNSRADHLLSTAPDALPGRRYVVRWNRLLLETLRVESGRSGNGEAPEVVLVDPLHGSDLVFEVEIVSLSASVWPAHRTIYLLHDLTGEPNAAENVHSRLKRMLADAWDSRSESDLLRGVMENLGVPVFVTDLNGEIILANRAAERLFLPDAGSSGERTGFRSTVPARVERAIESSLLRSATRGESYTNLLGSQVGRSIPAHIVSTEIHDGDGEPMAFVHVVHELTEQLANEQTARETARELLERNRRLKTRIESARSELRRRGRALATQRMELERASRMKSRFLATMSHELRTPVSAVIGYADLLLEGVLGELPEGSVSALHRQKRKAEHLLSLINDILDLSDVESGRMQLRSEAVDLRSILEAVTDAIQPLLEERSIEFRSEIAADLPVIRTDPERLHQVLINLVSNAVKFTDQGSVTVRAGAGAEGYAVGFDVIDTGVGIRQENLEEIFGVFRQLDETATRQHEGTGLGLTIAREVVRLLGGRITVESEYGEGSHFRVDLPSVPPREER